MKRILLICYFILGNITIQAQGKITHCSSTAPKADVHIDHISCMDNASSSDVNPEVKAILAEIEKHSNPLPEDLQIIECIGHNNCSATVDQYGRMTLIYDPYYLKIGVRSFGARSTSSLSAKKKNYWAYTILAHEVGHFLGMHLKSSSNQPIENWQHIEGEADYFAGKILALVGAKEVDIELLCKNFDKEEIGHHPDRDDRQDIILEGWEIIMGDNEIIQQEEAFQGLSAIKAFYAGEYEKAKILFFESLLKDDEGAYYFLAKIAEKKGDVKEAYFYYLKAAEVDNYYGREACQIIGTEYYNGEILEYDEEKAFYYIKQAASKGDTISQLYLGHFYKFGVGIDININQAISWWKKASDNGNITAHFLLGELYVEYDDIYNTKQKGIQLLKMASEAGDEEATEYLKSIE